MHMMNRGQGQGCGVAAGCLLKRRRGHQRCRFARQINKGTATAGRSSYRLHINRLRNAHPLYRLCMSDAQDLYLTVTTGCKGKGGRRAASCTGLLFVLALTGFLL